MEYLWPSQSTEIRWPPSTAQAATAMLPAARRQRLSHHGKEEIIQGSPQLSEAQKEDRKAPKKFAKKEEPAMEIDAGSSTKVAAVAAPEIGPPSFPKEGDRVEAKFTEGSVVSWSKGTVQKVSSKGAKKTVIVQFDGRVPVNCRAIYRLFMGSLSALHRLLICFISALHLLHIGYICSISAPYRLYIRLIYIGLIYRLDISA